jgi:hypothetical protein
LECTGRASEGSAVIFHTFDVLEQEVLNALYSMFPRVHAIGPLQLLLNQIQEVYLSSIGCNLWKEEVECLQWLDSNKPKSVIYVNFGSITTVTKEQLVEFGMGLAKSGHPFLWIIRPDMVTGDSAILPPEFTEETKERSFICSWCPQEEVLNHPSIGGFLTHSGRGSTIESISSGVPMLCWPYFVSKSARGTNDCFVGHIIFTSKWFNEFGFQLTESLTITTRHASFHEKSRLTSQRLNNLTIIYGISQI